MRKKRGIKKLVTFALLGVFMFSNTIPYQQFIQKNKQLEIQVQSQKKSNGLDVGVWSYSNVQTGVYQHSASANGAFSGWKSPGVEAHASKFIGTGTAECYWNCR